MDLGLGSSMRRREFIAHCSAARMITEVVRTGTDRGDVPLSVTLLTDLLKYDGVYDLFPI
jgi:hypothetical protein